ncbi:MAG: V-type ATP synthase subunit I [Pseudomonadota bacterium]
MSIARLKKVTLAGEIAQKAATLSHLQDLGCMHLVPLTKRPAEPEKAASREAEDAYKALRFLAEVAGERRQITRDRNFDVQSFVARTLDLRQNLREVGDRRDALEARIKAIEPWGDLDLGDAATMGGIRCWFYRLPVKHRAALQHLDLPWDIVSADTRFLYVVVLSPTEPPDTLLPIARTHVGSRPVHQLKEDLEASEIELEMLQDDRLRMARHVGLLRAHLSEAETLAELAFAAQQTRDDPDLFAVQGWVPDGDLSAVSDYAEANGLAMLVEPPAWDEEPPTLLLQPEAEAAGVDLATFYQVPNYRSWDPTLVLVASFAIFFAMIAADAGYGAVILVGLFVGWRRLGRSPKLKAWRRLGLIIAAATIVYGVLVGSYFGAPPPQGTVLASFAVLSLNDFDTMMRLSIIVGVVHLVLGIAINAWVHRRQRSARAKLGWIAAILGGLLLWLSGQTGPFAIAGIGLFIAGILAIVAFTSERPITKSLDWAWRVFDGVRALAGAMGAFGDILSYMRLFALGLASASLAVTFNNLAGDVMDGLPGLGLLLAILILLVGHVMNFGLVLMSGVVHGLRLNYIEFFKWGLPEEGTAFRPLARKEVQL